MKQVKHLRQPETPYSSHSIERRRMRRTCASFGLMYSGINGDDVLIGDGNAVDLSEGGLGIRGNCPVNVGMELTLFYISWTMRIPYLFRKRRSPGRRDLCLVWK